MWTVRAAFLLILASLVQGCALHGAGARSGAVTEPAVRAHLEFLASDAMNGRGSMTRDEQLAAEYVAAQFRALGLESVDGAGHYVQTIAISNRAVSGKPTLTVHQNGAPDLKWTAGSEFVVTLLGGTAISGPLQRVMTSDTRIQRGAIVYLPEQNFGRAFDVLLQGPAAVLMRGNLTPERWEAAAARPMKLQPELVDLPGTGDHRSVLTLNAAAATQLESIADGTRIEIAAQAESPRISHTYNAVGVIRGSDPSRRDQGVIVSAHLDHLGRVESAQGPDKIFNGADDDASGVVAVIELAAALAKRHPKRTIVFACFGSEESGGFGSTYFREKSPVPLDKTIADVNFEMIGRPDAAVPPHTLWLTGFNRSDLGSALASHGARIVADPHPDQHFFERSDNYTLALRGIVAHTVSSYGLHKEYHTPADETRLVDYAHMREAIASFVEPLAWLANSDFRPQWRPGGNPAGK
jgi:peptidase M28-like protein